MTSEMTTGQTFDPTAAVTTRVVTVAELMTDPVVAVGVRLDVLDALRVMNERGVRHLPVVEVGRCVGLVDVIELVAAAMRQGTRWLPVVVDEVCQRPPPTVEMRADRATAARRMAESGGDALVVLDGAELVGVLTAIDLVRSFAADQP